MADVGVAVHPGLLVETHPGDRAGDVGAELHPQLVRPPAVTVLGRGERIAPQGVSRRGRGARAGAGDVAVGRVDAATGGTDAVVIGRARSQRRVLVAGGTGRRGGDL